MELLKRKSIFLVLTVIVGLTVSSCLDDNTEEWDKQWEDYNKQVRNQFVMDSTTIVEYLEANDSMAIFYEPGIFYHIIDSGNQSKPTIDHSVEIRFKSTLLDGTIIDETTGKKTLYYPLSRLIPGLQIGVPLIGKEGKIVLYIPSYFAYQDKESDDLPANSVMIFNIELIDFNPY